MKLTKPKLRMLGLYNPHEFAKGRLYIDYNPADNGRGGRCAHWVVCWAGHATDPKAHFMDYGRKTFTVFGRAEREKQRLVAIEWAKKKYGIKEWSKTPFGSWMDADFVLERVAELIHVYKNGLVVPVQTSNKTSQITAK